MIRNEFIFLRVSIAEDYSRRKEDPENLVAEPEDASNIVEQAETVNDQLVLGYSQTWVKRKEEYETVLFKMVEYQTLYT